VLPEADIQATLRRYFDLLQDHVSAEAMMDVVLTPDFETGFRGGKLWRGLDGLREFLAAREGFFDERHEVREILSTSEDGGDTIVSTRLRFFLRRWEPPSAHSEEFTGDALHTWRLRPGPDGVRVAAQIVDGFADLDENSKRLFSTPEEGLSR